MQQQRTTSQTRNDHFFIESVQTNKFLINTSKVIKGNKLKTKDFVQMQLLRFRKCSPVKYQEIYPLQTSTTNHSKGFQFKKFKPFDSLNNEDMQKIVENERVKMSRETKGRIKMFNNTKINSMIASSLDGQESFPIKNKPTTGHQFRQLKKGAIGSKTVTNESMPDERKKQKKKHHTVFRSQNLGTKMNQYLNLYLNGENQTEKADDNESKSEQKHEEHIQKMQQKPFNTIDLYRKKPNTNFVRKMKKHIKSRVQTTDHDLLGQYKSQQLVKPGTSLSRRRQYRFNHSKQN